MKNKILIFSILLTIFSCKKENVSLIAKNRDIIEDSITTLKLPIDSKSLKYNHKDKNGYFIYDETFKKNKYSNSLSRVYGKIIFNKNIDLIIIERKPSDDEYKEPIITLYSYEKKIKQKIDSLNLYETIKSEATVEKRFLIDKDTTINIYENSSGYDIAQNGKDTLIIEKFHKTYYISTNGKFIIKEKDIANNTKKSITKPDKTWIGEYIIKTDALSNADNKKFTLRYYITINSLSDAILSIGAENPQDYTCEGDYSLQIDNNTLFASGKCDEDDINNFYIKKENNSFFIKSKRFLSKDWLELKKE